MRPRVSCWRPADLASIATTPSSGMAAAAKSLLTPCKRPLRGSPARWQWDALQNDQLWALKFANNHPAGPSNGLFSTAGVGDEAHSLFGFLTPMDNTAPEGNSYLNIAIHKKLQAR